MRTLSIAAIQTSPVANDLDASWVKFEHQVRTTRKLFPHVQLVTVPELLLAGQAPLFDAPEDWTRRSAQPIPGKLTDMLAELARDTGLWLVPGSLHEEAPDGHVYNTAVAIAPDGEIVARYRKVFPWQPWETTEPGDRFVVFDIPDIGRVGLAISYDGSFPETIRQLAWLGAEVIIQPTLTATRDREMELVCSRANAWTNQVFVVNINASDPAGVGTSVIVDPEGMIRQQAGPGEEILVDVLDLDTVTRVREFGSTGLNRPWSQLGRYGSRISLPMYRDGTFQPAPWAQG